MPISKDWYPTVSVVVAVFNGEKTVAECVRSLIAVDYPQSRREFIFVDNGSTDRTGAILAALATECGIRVLAEPRRGRSAARNRGWRNANHEIVAVTDADCVADPGWLRGIVSPLAAADVGAAGGRVLARRPCNRVEAFGEEIHDARAAIEKYQPPYAMTGNVAYRRTVLEQLRGFDESFPRGQDVDLSWRIVEAGYRLAYAPGAVVYHRNERGYAGLFRVGLAHGFHGVALRDRHRVLLRAAVPKSGRRSPANHGLHLMRTATKRLLRKEDGEYSVCRFVFDFGKGLGRVAGGLGLASRPRYGETEAASQQSGT